MKLTKSALRQMIKEAYKDGEPDLHRKGKSKGQQSKELRQTAKDVADGTVGGEFTPIERSLVQQVSQVITDIAAAPDVDLGQFRAQLNTILKRLVKITAADLADLAAQGEDKPDADAAAADEEAAEQ